MPELEETSGALVPTDEEEEAWEGPRSGEMTELPWGCRVEAPGGSGSRQERSLGL